MTVSAQRRKAIADDYWAAEGQTIALAHRNMDVDRINAAIRAAGVETGLVTEFQQYAAGSGVVRFASGDRVIANAAIPAHKILKGSFGVVQAAETGGLEVVFDGHHDPVSLDDRTAARLGLGYAVTIHKAQGVTADTALVLASGTMDKHLGYVAMSRHRRHLRLHCRSFQHRRGRPAGPAPPVAGRARIGDLARGSPCIPARETVSEPAEVRLDARSERLVAVMEKAAAYYQGVLQGDGGTAAREPWLEGSWRYSRQS